MATLEARPKYGPLEYYIIGFQHGKFRGEIASSLKNAARSGAIRILDLVFVSKDDAGNVARIEYQDFDPDIASEFSALDPNGEGMFSGEELDDIGEAIDPNTSAAFILVEHRWAADIRAAVMRANGRLIANDMLTADAAQSLESNA